LSGSPFCSEACAGNLQIAHEVATIGRPAACVELDRARRAGPSPRGEQRRRCPPTRRCSLSPAAQPPLKLAGAATSAAPGASERYQPIGGCLHRIRSAVWFRARCCLRATSLGRDARSPPCCGNREHCGCCGDRLSVQEPSKVENVAVFRVHRGRGGAHWFCRPHLTDTTVRPLAPHPRHRTRPVRSSTLAPGAQTEPGRNSGVSNAT
jgi:hypothetical protein